MSAESQSPPFRDSDALYIIAKRMERLADQMTSHDYSQVQPDLVEIQEWLDWLAASIAAREAERWSAGGAMAVTAAVFAGLAVIAMLAMVNAYSRDKVARGWIATVLVGIAAACAIAAAWIEALS